MRSPRLRAVRRERLCRSPAIQLPILALLSVGKHTGSIVSLHRPCSSAASTRLPRNGRRNQDMRPIYARCRAEARVDCHSGPNRRAPAARKAADLQDTGALHLPNSDFSPRLDDFGRAGLQPRRNRGCRTLLVPHPAQLAAASCAGWGTWKQSGGPCSGGAKAPPFQIRGEKSGLRACQKNLPGLLVPASSIRLGSTPISVCSLFLC